MIQSLSNFLETVDDPKNLKKLWERSKTWSEKKLMWSKHNYRAKICLLAGFSTEECTWISMVIIRQNIPVYSHT